MSLRRWALLTFCLFVLLSAGGSLAFGPWVRSQAQSRAQRFGASLSIGSVRPAWLGVRLVDVTVVLPELPAVSLHLDQVVVDSDRSVHAIGGQLVVHGSLRELQDQLTAWRAAHAPPPAGPSEDPASRVVDLSAVTLDWSDPFGPGTSARASGASSPDLRHLTSLRLSTFDLRGARYHVNGSDLFLAWVRGDTTKLQLVRAGEVRAEATLAAVATEVDPVAPAASASAAQGDAPAGSSKPPSDVPHSSVVTANELTGRLDTMKARLTETLRGLTERVRDDARIEVGALEVQLQLGAERLTLGPGPFEASRQQGVVVLSLAPGATAAQSGVTFRAELPLRSGDLRLDVVGGPISLATLGVHEGDLGLAGIDKTSLQVNLHLAVKEDGASVAFEGNVRAKDLNIAHPKLAERTVEGLVVAAKVKGEVRTDGTRLELEESEFDVGAVQLELAGTLERKADLAIDVRFGIPLVSCRAFLDALPTALIPVVKGMSAEGTLSLTGRLRFDPARVSDYLLDYQAANDCRVTSVPAAVNVTRFQAPFRRMVYGPDGKQVEIESGPGTPGWTSLNAMSRFLEVAVMTTEDGHFRTHHGFDHEAIRNSVRENLVKRKFVRGASTISMQLAKNLYLDRRKTVSRKLQELILTAYLEQALTKDQILELYLNAIEFGPMIYGAGPAAYHYFHTSASSLSLGQALYMSSILPNPAQQHFGADGRVSEGWMGYLHKLMKNAERRRWIDAEELESGLGEWVVYGSPEPIRTAPEPGGEPGSGEEPPEPGWQDDGAGQ